MDRRRPIKAPPADGSVEALHAEVQQLKGKLAEHERELAELRKRAQAKSDVLDIEGAAEFLLCSARTVERMVQSKRIPCTKIHGGRGVRFVRADLISWLRRGAPKTVASRFTARR